MTYQTSEKYSYITEQKSDKSTDKSHSNVLSTQTPTSQVVLTSTITYTYVSPVESKEIVYKLSHSRKA